MIVPGMTHARRALAGALAAFALSAPQAQTPAPIETTTPAGDRILLHPDGRWEYADPAKRAAMPQPPSPAAVATTATPAATASGACPPGAQGHLFWIGRCVLPGDRDYNRGSLSGKGH